MELRVIPAIRKLASRLTGEPVWRGGPRDIVATLYEDGVIIAVSNSADEIIGAAGNLVGRSLYDFVARADRAPLRDALSHAAARGVYADPAKLSLPFTLLRVRRAGASAEIFLRPIGRGRLSALIRQRSEVRTPQLAANTASPEVEPPSVDLMADLAHEMKTPLNAIMGFADAMREETYGPLGADVLGARKYAEYIEHIHASGAHLTALISAAQDYAKTRAGKYTIERASADPGAVAAACAEMVRGAAEKAGLKLKLRIAQDLPAAMLDERAVKQVLINLLSNAVKFTEEGEVQLSVVNKNNGVEFIVSDTGVGMNKVVLAKLGGRYSDTHTNGVRGATGSGLGLSLAFELARLHGGALTIDSAPGEGTTARLHLPLAADKKKSAPAVNGADIQSQLDRVNAFRAERAGRASAA